MTAFRSQTDERLAARWDKEPWVNGHGKRYADDGTAFMGVVLRKSNDMDGWNCSQCIRLLAPRPECIPSRDPLPYEGPFGNRRSTPMVNFLWRPRPEFARPPVNRVLAEFRRSEPWNLAEAARIEAGWLRQPGARPVPADATPDEIKHARKVLTRLAALS